MERKKFFICRVKVRKATDNGEVSGVNEQHLVEAVNYTEAETRLNEIMTGYEFAITGITKSNIAEVHSEDSDEDNWKTKISMVVFDDISGAEKTSSFFMLIGGETIRKVYDKVKEIMQNSRSGYVVMSVAHTKILEVHKQ